MKRFDTDIFSGGVSSGAIRCGFQDNGGRAPRSGGFDPQEAQALVARMKELGWAKVAVRPMTDKEIRTFSNGHGTVPGDIKLQLHAIGKL